MAACSIRGVIPAPASKTPATESETVMMGIRSSSSASAWAGRGGTRLALPPMRMTRSMFDGCFRFGSAITTTATAPWACAISAFTRLVA